jgi:hypothetical protein
MTSASVTSCAVIVSLIDQPTTRRENRSVDAADKAAPIHPIRYVAGLGLLEHVPLAHEVLSDCGEQVAVCRPPYDLLSVNLRRGRIAAVLKYRRERA